MLFFSRVSGHWQVGVAVDTSASHPRSIAHGIPSSHHMYRSERNITRRNVVF